MVIPCEHVEHQTAHSPIEHLRTELVAPALQQRWLLPLVQGHVRSCFCRTEPAPGSGSDLSVLQTTAKLRVWHCHCHWLLDSGITDETIVSRIFTDMRGFRIYDGPSEVHRWRIGSRIARG